jgi:hypothetical protein
MKIGLSLNKAEIFRKAVNWFGDVCSLLLLQYYHMKHS